MTISKNSGFSIKLDSINFEFKNRPPLFDDLNLEIQSGQFVSLCGKSGVGKSTLLKLIAGLYSPSAGQIFYNGAAVKGVAMGLAMVSQDYSKSLFPWFSIEKNIALAISKFGYSSAEKIAVIRESLETVGLGHTGKFRPRELSGGMQQRVCIARAIAMKPRLLLLDEPFASLDSFTRIELEDLILKITAELKTTTVLVTHDIDQAIYLSDRVLTLKDNPVRIGLDIEVKLGKPRNQISTRAHRDFQALRGETFKNLT